MLCGNLKEETDRSEKKEFWHSNIEVSGWNETDFRDKRGHTYLPVPDKKSKMWRNITVSSRIPKNESNELVAFCTSPRPLIFRACSL